jgi:ribonuclease HII
MKRQPPSLTREMALYAQGYRRIAGLDEAGRGAWAGPLTAAAVTLPLGRPDLADALEGVCDSKQLAPAKRETLYSTIVRVAVAVGVGIVPPADVDSLGVVEATRRAMALSLEALGPPPDYLIIDFLALPAQPIPQLAIIHADALCLSVAAASIIAKVSRDRLMVALGERFPAYGFARHKGYGTALHRQALARSGPSPLHRLSYAPLRALLAAPANCVAL